MDGNTSVIVFCLQSIAFWIAAMLCYGLGPRKLELTSLKGLGNLRNH